MNQFKTFKIAVDRRQESYGAPYTDPKVWIRAELKEHGKGIDHLSFLLIGDECEQLFKHGGTFSDGYHLLRTFGELWTFFNLDQFPNEASGIAPVAYTRLKMPRDIRERIAQDIENALSLFDTSEPNKYGHKEEIAIDYSDALEVWGSDYGQGTGKIEIEADTATRDLLGTYAGEKTFDRSWGTLERLALNTTHKKSDVGTIKIYTESPRAFMWSAGGMHGGLINHGTEESPDWSVHT